MKRPRLCFVSQGAGSLFFPDLPPRHGGAETQLYLIANELVARDRWDIHFLIRPHPGLKQQGVNGVTVHPIPFSGGVKSKLAFQLRLARLNPAVVLQRGMGSTTRDVAIYRRWAGKKMIYFSGSDADFDPAIRKPGVTRSRGFEWGLRQSDVHIAQSSRQAEALARQEQREAIVLPNAFPPRRPSGQLKSYILWIGRFAPVKRPELFIDLAERLPGFSFVMIAMRQNEADEKAYLAVKDRIDRLSNLEYVPGVPLGDIPAWIDKATVVVNTSISEGFPNAFIQALWAGVRIAGLNVDPGDIIREHGLGVPPDGADDIATFGENLRNFLLDDSAFRRAGVNAYLHAERHHNIARYVDSLEDILWRLLGRDPKKSQS